MAKHNRTPRSVLEAPTLAPIWLVRHTALNRHRRRHTIARADARSQNIPRQLQVPAGNTPYRKPTGGAS